MTLVHRGHGGLAERVDRTPTALGLPDGLTFDEWTEVGEPLLAAGDAVQWWLGDWLRYGERVYGHAYRDVALLTNLEPGTLANYQSVAESVPPERRRESLSWSHHRAIAALSAQEQVQWLKAATDAGWSSRDLDAEVRRSRSGRSPGRSSGGEALVVRVLEVKVPAAGAERASAVLTAVADQLRDELADVGATVEVR